MINMPNAAGFIPSESVVDGIAKLYNLFSPEAKAKRQADLSQTQAQTGQTQAQTGYIGAETTALPQKTAQGWGNVSNDSRRVKVLEAELPQKDRALNLKEQQDLWGHQSDESRLAEEKRQHDIQGSEFQEQMGQKMREWGDTLGLKKLELGQQGQEITNRGDYYKSQAKHQEDEDLLHRMDLLQKMTGFDQNSPEALALKSVIYKNVAPEVRTILEQHEAELRRIRESVLSRTKGRPTWTSPGTTPVPSGLPTLNP